MIARVAVEVSTGREFDYRVPFPLNCLTEMGKKRRQYSTVLGKLKSVCTACAL